MEPRTKNPDGAARPDARLGLGDAISLMVGIVVGASVYETPPEILRNVSSPWRGLGVWALGGALSLAGALCYAELASTYPGVGGDYIYLRRAFGPWLGFLFGWAQLVVVRTANLGMMAFIFARYAGTLWDLPDESAPILAVAAVAVLSVFNLLGVVLGKWVQNALSLAKVLGLAGIVAAGLCWGQPGAFHTGGAVTGPGFGWAMILVLFAYGGWSDAAFVAAELRRPRDIPRILVLGTAAITLIYLAVNAAYIVGLGFDGVRTSKAVAAELLDQPLGAFAAKAMCVLVMVSALGSINGTIFAGARVYAALGADHPAFAWLGRWHPRSGSPPWSLVAQALISSAMIAAVSTVGGPSTSGPAVVPPGQQSGLGGFEALLAGTTPVFWLFFLLTGVALFVLRRKDRRIERPFALRRPFYPLVPLLFCGTCLFMLYAALVFAGRLALLGVAPLLLGLPLYFLSGGKEARAEKSADALAAPWRE
jgi:amino acid transporter